MAVVANARASDCSSTTTSATTPLMFRLPLELTEMIANELHGINDFDVCRLRATCKDIEAKTRRVFLGNSFDHRYLRLSEIKLESLETVSRIDELALLVREISVVCEDEVEVDATKGTMTEARWKLVRRLHPTLKRFVNLEGITFCDADDWYDGIGRKVKSWDISPTFTVVLTAVNAAGIQPLRVIMDEQTHRARDMGLCNVEALAFCAGSLTQLQELHLQVTELEDRSYLETEASIER